MDEKRRAELTETIERLIFDFDKVIRERFLHNVKNCLRMLSGELFNKFYEHQTKTMLLTNEEVTLINETIQWSLLMAINEECEMFKTELGDYRWVVAWERRRQ